MPDLLYDSPNFEALASIAFYDTNDNSDDILEPKVPVLTSKEEALYRPIWDRLVDKEKVLTVLGPNAKVPTCESQVKLAGIEFWKVNKIVSTCCLSCVCKGSRLIGSL